MQNFLITIVILALLVGGGVLLLRSSPEPQPENVSPTPREREEGTTTPATVPANWNTFDHEEYGFTFRYPPDATTTLRRERGVVRVQQTGPRQEPNTEVTDGYTIWIQNIRQEQATSPLKNVAVDLLEKQTERNEVVEELATTTVNASTAYSFAVETELGSVAHHRVWRVPGNSYIHANYSISGTATATPQYQETVDSIIKTVHVRDTR